MGMYACLKRVPFKEISQCKENAIYAKHYISGVQGDTELINLKESWDGLHYLLSPKRRKPSKVWDTSVVWDNIDPMGIALVGKDVLNKDCKYGFGNPKWIDPEQVHEIARTLKDLDWEQVSEAYVPEKMQKCGVYPEELWADVEKGRKYLRYWFVQLSKFYEKAASLDQAVICYLKI
jgi:hypothetical protein